nr:MAG TPA: hypothetical protein [Caudoviricetes sp.]
MFFFVLVRLYTNNSRIYTIFFKHVKLFLFFLILIIDYTALFTVKFIHLIYK